MDKQKVEELREEHNDKEENNRGVGDGQKKEQGKEEPDWAIKKATGSLW